MTASGRRTRRSPAWLRKAQRAIEAKRAASDRPAKDNVYDWLDQHRDVWHMLTSQAINAAQGSAARLPEADQQAIDVRPPRHLVCGLLAELAVALAQVKDVGETVGQALAEYLIPDDRQRSRFLTDALRAIVRRVAERVFERAVDATEAVQRLELMARIAAVTACPELDDHSLVKQFQEELLEQTITEVMADTLRETASSVAS